MKTLLMILLPVAITMEDENTSSLEKNIITTTTGAKLPQDNKSKSFNVNTISCQHKLLEFFVI